MDIVIFVLLLSVLLVIASLLFGVWITVASVNYKLGQIRGHFERLEAHTARLGKLMEAPHDLSQLTEIEIPVLCAALSELAQAYAEHSSFNLSYRKN